MSCVSIELTNFEGFKTQIECDFLCAGQSSINVQKISMEVLHTRKHAE